MELKNSPWSLLKKFPKSHRPKKSGDRSYITINSGRGCSSVVGKQGRPQTLSLSGGCLSDGTIAHEFIHALGFHHEQNRPDRDQYVKINFQNIYSQNSFNFRKQSSSRVTTFGVPYDGLSIMHYRSTAFSKNRRPTIEAKSVSYFSFACLLSFIQDKIE